MLRLSCGEKIGWRGRGWTKPSKKVVVKVRMVRGLLCASFMVLFLCFAQAAQGAVTYYVSPDGNGDCTEGSPCPFQTALTAAQQDNDDSIILVGGGKYNISQTLTYTAADGDGKLTVQASSTSDRPVLDGGNNVQIMNINNDNDTDHSGDNGADIAIKNLIFKKGLSFGTNTGGGLWITTGAADIAVRSSNFENNIAYYGGGAYLWSTSGDILVSASVFDSNAAIQGGGGIRLYSETGDVMLLDVTFSNNNAEYGGGGHVRSNSGNAAIVNSIFSSNNATYGGGLWLPFQNGTATVVNNSFYGNKAVDEGGGLYARLIDDSAVLNIYNNILWNNTSAPTTGDDLYVDSDANGNAQGSTVNLYHNDFGEQSDFNGGSQGLYITDRDNYYHCCNIKQDPAFADATNGDFHLQAASPCIDMGCNTAPEVPGTDFEEDSRIIDGDRNGEAVVDMGADEYKPSILPTVPPPSDVEATIGEVGQEGSITISWKPIRGAEGYLIYNADTDQLMKWVKDGSSTSYTFHNLPCGRTYRFYVKTHSSYGNSQHSDTVAIVVPCLGGGANPTIGLVWPADNSAISYNDFSAADYLVVFAWKRVDVAKGYLLSLSLDNGKGKPATSQMVFSNSNGLIEVGNLAGIYFILDSASWNNLVPYVVTWQVNALSDPQNLNSILSSSGKYNFTFNPAP